MFVDLFHTKKLRLALIYIAFLILVQFLQDTVLARLAVFGVKTLFVPAAITAVGFHEGGFRGGLYGLLAGILCDMTYAENTVLFTVLFPLLGFGGGLCAESHLLGLYVYRIYLPAADGLCPDAACAGAAARCPVLLSADGGGTGIGVFAHCSTAVFPCRTDLYQI